MVSTQDSSLSWTDRLTTYLMDALVNEFRMGTGTDKGFKSTGWTRIKDEFNQRSGRTIAKSQLASKYSDIRKKYSIFDNLRNNSGFGWDDIRKLPTAPNETWEAYLRAHPKAAPYRYRSFPNLELAELLFGGQIATGQHAMSSALVSVPRMRAVPRTATDDFDYEDDVEGSEDQDDTRSIGSTPAITEDDSWIPRGRNAIEDRELRERAQQAGPPTKRARRLSAVEQSRQLLHTLVERNNPTQHAMELINGPECAAALQNNPRLMWCVRMALRGDGMAEAFITASTAERILFINDCSRGRNNAGDSDDNNVYDDEEN